MADNDGSGLIEGNLCTMPSDLRLYRLRGCTLCANTRKFNIKSYLKFEVYILNHKRNPPVFILSQVRF